MVQDVVIWRSVLNPATDRNNQHPGNTPTKCKARTQAVNLRRRLLAAPTDQSLVCRLQAATRGKTAIHQAFSSALPEAYQQCSDPGALVLVQALMKIDPISEDHPRLRLMITVPTLGTAVRRLLARRRQTMPMELSIWKALCPSQRRHPPRRMSRMMTTMVVTMVSRRTCSG